MSTSFDYLNDPSRHLVGGFTSPVNQFLTKQVFPLPLLQPTLPQKIIIIELQLFEAGTCYLKVDEVSVSALESNLRYLMDRLS
jgi:hypothetical protein